MKLKILFKHSWNIVWQNPILWLFGFFAAIFANNEINLIVVNFRRINNWIDQLITFKAIKTQFREILSTLDPKQIFTSTALYNLILAFIVIVLFLYICIISQIALISLIKKIKYKKTSSQILKKSKKFFWPVLSVYILIYFITYGFLYLLNLPLFYKAPVPIIVYIIIFLLIAFFLSFILRFTILFIILEKEKIIAGIKKGSIFFFKNFFVTIKTSLCLFLITILFGISLFLVYMGTAFPLLAVMGLFLYLNFAFGFWITIILLTVILSVFFLLFSSIFSSFQFSVWTLLFLKLRDQSGHVKE